MPDDEKQSNKLEEERPQADVSLEETAADQVRNALETRLGKEAKTVWRPGVISQPIDDPFENTPDSNPQQEPEGSPGPGTPESAEPSEKPAEVGSLEGTGTEPSKD